MPQRARNLIVARPGIENQDPDLSRVRDTWIMILSQSREIDGFLRLDKLA
jgi:hypothetical protein